MNNPVMLKELRQSVRNRLASISLIGFLALLLVILGFVFAAYTHDTHIHSAPSPIGPTTFGITASILSLLTLTVIPFAVFQRLSVEHGKAKADLLFATPLTPARIVDGKLFAGLSMALLFLSAALPFLFLSYQLHGIDLGTIVGYVVLLLPAIAASLALGLFAGSLPVPTTVTRVLYGLALFGAIGPIIAFCVALATDEFINFSIYGYLSIFAALLAVFFLLRSAAILTLAPAATNYARPFRLTVSALWLLLLLVFGILAVVEDESEILYASFLSTLLLAGLLLFQAVLIRPEVSRRVLQDIRPRFRFLQFLFGTTYEGGAALSVLLAALSVGLHILLSETLFHGIRRDLFLLRILPPFLYYAAFLMLLRLLARTRTRYPGPVALTLLAVLIPFGWSTATTIVSANVDNRLTLSGNFAPGNLFATMINADYNRDALVFHLVFAAILFLILLLVTLPKIRRAYKAFRHP